MRHTGNRIEGSNPSLSATYAAQQRRVAPEALARGEAGDMWCVHILALCNGDLDVGSVDDLRRRASSAHGTSTKMNLRQAALRLCPGSL